MNRQQTLKGSGHYLFLSLLSLLFIVPFGYAVYTSLLGKADIDTLVPVTRFTFENYGFILRNSSILRWYLNSVVMTSGILLGNLLINSLAGYALAKLNFPGRTVAFYIIISTMMIPYQLCIIPTYAIIVQLRWVNTFKALILPFLFQGFLTFLMRQYFITLPKDLGDAARVDGLSMAGTFFRIILPMSASALSVLIIFSFTGTWNSFIWPVTLVNDDRMFVLTVGLNTLKNRHFEWANITMSGIVLMTLPVVAMFLTFQKRFVQSLATTGIKG